MESFAVVFNDNLGFRPCDIGLKSIDPRHFASLGAQRDFAIEPGARKRISSSLLGKGKQEDGRGFHGRTRAIVGIFCRLGRFRDSGEPFCALAKGGDFRDACERRALDEGIFERFVDGKESAKLADDANELGERQKGRNLDDGEFGRSDALFGRY